MSVFKEILAVHGLKSEEIQIKAANLKGKSADVRQSAWNDFAAAVDAVAAKKRGRAPTAAEGTQIVFTLARKQGRKFQVFFEAVKAITGLTVENLLTLPSDSALGAVNSTASTKTSEVTLNMTSPRKRQPLPTVSRSFGLDSILDGQNYGAFTGVLTFGNQSTLWQPPRQVVAIDLNELARLNDQSVPEQAVVRWNNPSLEVPVHDLTEGGRVLTSETEPLGRQFVQGFSRSSPPPAPKPR